MDKSPRVTEEKRLEINRTEEPITTIKGFETRTSTQREGLVESSLRSWLPALCGGSRSCYAGRMDTKSRKKANEEQYTTDYHKLVLMCCTSDRSCLIVKLFAGKTLC